MKPPLTRATRFVISTSRIATIRFQITHFSTSHNYVSRRQEEEARNVRVSVWWDVESCSLPVGGSSGYRIVQSITNALRANGIKGPLQISAFGNVMKIPKGTQEVLSSTGITLMHLPGGKDNDRVNRSMIIELMYWVSQHPPPAHIFMISGDHEMASVLHRLRMSNYNILLAGPEDASVALCSAASIMWQWNALVKGENLVGKHFNQPPDGPSGSWYGTYRVPLESPLPAVEESLPAIEKPLPARESEPAESQLENSVQDIPPEVTEQIQRILISYPNGVPITTLREELRVIVDKNMYGYKKFSSLLLAMPQILELCPHKHGQHLVRAVNSKAPISIDSPMKASENSLMDDTNRRTPPTQIGVCDEKCSLKSTEELCTHNSHPVTNEKSTQIESDPQSVPTCNEQPLMKEGCDGPPTNDKDVESESASGSATIEKQENASEDGIFRRTWTKLFGDANKDAAEKNEGNYLVQRGPSSDYSRSHDATSNENPVGPGSKILKFCSRLLYGFKTDGIDSESADAGSCSTNVPSQVDHHSLRNDAFSKEGFWTEMKAFMCSPEGANVVAKSVSRQQMARELKKEGPSVLSSFGKDDLLHLVNLLIDNKKWIEECLSKTSPFKVICTPVDLPEKYSNSNAKSFMASDETQQTNEREYGRGSTHQFSSLTKSRMLADCQKLVDGIVKTHPKGYSLSGFRKLFFERYNYCLQLRYLEFDKLTSLINTMSGVRLKGDVIYPSENPPSSTPGSLDTDLLYGMKRTSQTESDNEISVPSTHSDISDSLFDEQLGPVKSLNKNMPSSLGGNLKPKKDKGKLLQYEPCSEEDIYTDSDGETRTKEEAPKVHKEVSTLIDILSNWEAKKDVASKSNLSETIPKDNLQNPIKGHSPAEVSRKTSRITAHKWKSPRTFNFVSDDHKNEVELKDTTEPRQQC